MPATPSLLLDKDPAGPRLDSLVGVIANLAVVAAVFLPWYAIQYVPEGGGLVGLVTVWDALSYVLANVGNPEVDPAWVLVITVFFVGATVCPLGLHLWGLVGRIIDESF